MKPSTASTGQHQTRRPARRRRSVYADFYAELLELGARTHVREYRRLGARHGLTGRRLNQIAAGRCPGVEKDGDYRQITQYGVARA